MTHVAEILLQELASGLREDAPARRHLLGCEVCRRRLDVIVAERAEVLDDERFARALARLPRREVERPRTVRLFVWVPIACALAAFVLLGPRPTAPRAKGAPALYAVAASGSPATLVRPGDRLRLEASAAGLPFAFVVVIGTEGPPGWLWPEGGDSSGRVPTDGVLVPSLRVTPGDVALVGVFSERPIARDAVLGAWGRALGKSAGTSLTGREADLPPIADERERSTVVLHVASE